MIVLSGARIFDGENFLADQVVVVDGERIAAIVPYAERPPGAAQHGARPLQAVSIYRTPTVNRFGRHRVRPAITRTNTRPAYGSSGRLTRLSGLSPN